MAASAWNCFRKVLHVEDLLQELHQFVDSWCTRVRQSINHDKMENIVFTRKYKWVQSSDFQLGGQRLENKSSVKYLGDILESKLSWNEHLDTFTKKFMACH